MKNILSALIELLYVKGVLSSTECEYILKTVNSIDVKEENIYYAIRDVIEGDMNV